ncbi:methyltransferase domain-containing protein [Sporosarcina sp. FA9]|uniref:methyltransferase domain-containing protein n=1 Tax=Sporosarcina sp. FA9 TaxID=3413030 RepID=UPI003F6554E4
MSLIIADQVKEVIGVEINNDGVKDAVINAKRNSINNVRFHRTDVGKFMVELAMKNEAIDIVIMDAPRVASDEAFYKLNPKKIVYISCNPETQAGDLAFLVEHGYQVKGIQPVDMFPQTNYIKTGTRLTRNDTTLK